MTRPPEFARCPDCGTDLGSDAATEGLCPRCLLSLALVKSALGAGSDPDGEEATLDRPDAGQFLEGGRSPLVSLPQDLPRGGPVEGRGLLVRVQAGIQNRLDQRQAQQAPRAQPFRRRVRRQIGPTVRTARGLRQTPHLSLTTPAG